MISIVWEKLNGKFFYYILLVNLSSQMNSPAPIVRGRFKKGKCGLQNCGKIAVFGDKLEDGSKHCNEHRKSDDVDLTRVCIYGNCTHYAIYNYLTGKSVYCRLHALPRMLNINAIDSTDNIVFSRLYTWIHENMYYGIDLLINEDKKVKLITGHNPADRIYSNYKKFNWTDINDNSCKHISYTPDNLCYLSRIVHDIYLLLEWDTALFGTSTYYRLFLDSFESKLNKFNDDETIGNHELYKFHWWLFDQNEMKIILCNTIITRNQLKLHVARELEFPIYVEDFPEVSEHFKESCSREEFSSWIYEKINDSHQPMINSLTSASIFSKNLIKVISQYLIE